MLSPDDRPFFVEASDQERAKRLTVHFSGTVQGVGFRYTTVHEAKGFRVRGYVKNLPDGRVVMVAEGNPVELDRFLARLQKVFKRNVRQVQRVVGAATGEFDGFDIRF